MKKVFKSILSVISVAPITIATILPAANIGREHPEAYQTSIPATYVGGQTLITAPARLSDAQVFEFSGLNVALKDLPLVTPAGAKAGSPKSATATPSKTAGSYTLGDLMFQGVIHWEGLKFTYYSQSVLPGGGLNIPGRHVNSGGYVSDADGFIVLAGSAALGTVYNTPFGYPGKIYDRGTVGKHLDVYTM